MAYMNTSIEEVAAMESHAERRDSYASIHIQNIN